jgi:hypothetical protein
VCGISVVCSILSTELTDVMNHSNKWIEQCAVIFTCVRAGGDYCEADYLHVHRQCAFIEYFRGIAAAFMMLVKSSTV